jgi:urease accessory protein
VSLEADRIFAANRARGEIAIIARNTGVRTRAQSVHEAGSLRVRFPKSASAELEAVIINTAGGIAGGDCLNVAIRLEANARLVATSAAAEKIYRSLGPEAKVRIRLELGSGSTMAWLPQEAILFDGARIVRAIEADLAEDARLMIVEAVVFGRSGMGERVVTGQLNDRWRVRRAGQLKFADGVHLGGAIAETLAVPGVANGAVGIASLLVVPGDEAIVAAVRAIACRCCGEVGVSSWDGLALVRFCANNGAALRHDLVNVLTRLRGTALPRLWLN